MTCLDLFGPGWTCLELFDLFGPVWTCLDLFEPIWTELDIFGPIWTYFNLFGYIWTYLDAHKDIQNLKKKTGLGRPLLGPARNYYNYIL